MVSFINNIVYRNLDGSYSNLFDDIDMTNSYYKDVVKATRRS